MRNLLIAIFVLLPVFIKAYALSVSVINGNNLPVSKLVFLASLQGIAIKNQEPVYLNIGEYDFWMREIEKQHTITETSIKQIVDKVDSHIKGYILCDSSNISVAATVAAHLDAVVITDLDIARLYIPRKKMLMDVRQKDESWLFGYVSKNLHKYNLKGILQHNPERPYALIDLAIAKNMLCIVGRNNAPLVEKFYNLIQPNSPRLGWGAPYKNERLDVGLGAKHGLYTLPSSNTLNLSFFSSMPVSPTNNGMTSRRNKLNRKNVHYVMLMFSDGDNLNWHFSGLASSSKYMAHSACGNYPLNWMYPSSLSVFAPLVDDYFKRNLPKNNYFLGAVSGEGYTFPSMHKECESYYKKSNEGLERAGLDYMVIMDVLNFKGEEKNVLTKLVDHMPRLKGLFYMDYGNYAKWKGDYYFVGDIPVVSFRYRLWKPNNTIEKIAANINKASRDVTSIQAYSAVVIHAWSYEMKEIEQFIASLDDDVVLVNADTFMNLIKQNIKK